MLCDAKGKDERKNRNVLRASWKRERDNDASGASSSGVCARQDAASPPRGFLPPHSPPSPSRGAMTENNSGANNAAVAARRQPDDSAAKKHRAPTEKLKSLFSLPSCPGSGAPPPSLSSSLPPSLSSSLNKPLLSPALPLSPHRPLPQTQVHTRSVGTNTQDRGSAEGELPQRGPCQPGTSVNLEGIVWHETQEGVLVVNVTWRKRTYVGTLLDCTKHDWAPPRFCESPCSDPELPGGRGRGKRLRLALGERSCIDSSPAAKVRGLTTQHRSRGGSSNSLHKGRRSSLNLINANGRSSFFTVDDVKSTNSLSAKRKNKPPEDLDLSLVSADDIKNGNGKRIRAKSRSAPSTPQGKNDPSFMDPGGGGLPILIDCPHPNCTKRYKHINGLRYHQTHAHLEAEKPEIDVIKDADSEDRLSDCEDGIASYELSESKKAAPLYKVTTVGSPKNRRLLLSTDQSAKTRRTSILKDGLIDDLTNLPIISNMTVVLENCMVPDRNSSVEMPKLEAEGLIDKKSKKANGKVEKLSKSRIHRPIAPAPAPPKLIAIPNTSYAANSENQSQQQQPLSLTTKNIPLKPIKPKLSLVVEPSLVKATLVGCSKEMKKKEKKRLKDKLAKDCATRTANGESINIEENGTKMAVKEIPGSLLKEHLSKQEVMNGVSETQESRMASIRAEADKVYTFTDNAPSPSIGGSSRVDGCSVDSKTNSPAYSDISDAGEDGAAKSVSSDANSAHGNPAKTPAKENPQSPYYHGYDPYYLQGYAPPERPRKERKEEAKEDEKGAAHDFSESRKVDGQSQLQLAMSQTALAQSLYYGQYSRGLYVDQKLVLASKCGDAKPRVRECDETKHGKDGVKSPKRSYVELSERAADRGQQRDTDELSQAELDSSAPYATASDVWRSFVPGKYSEEEEGGALELTAGAQGREGKPGDEPDQQGAPCEDSQSARAAVSPPSPPQPYAQYHAQAYPPYLPGLGEPSAGSYRGLSPTLVHSYPGFHYPLYGKTAGREELEGAVTRGGAVSSKHADATGLELLPPSHHFHGKSPAPGEKGSPEGDVDRTHVSFGRHLHSHSALGLSYSLVPQYELFTESDGKK